jgi:hypothetical protein
MGQCCSQEVSPFNIGDRVFIDGKIRVLTAIQPDCCFGWIYFYEVGGTSVMFKPTQYNAYIYAVSDVDQNPDFIIQTSDFLVGTSYFKNTTKRVIRFLHHTYELHDKKILIEIFPGQTFQFRGVARYIPCQESTLGLVPTYISHIGDNQMGKQYHIISYRV